VSSPQRALRRNPWCGASAGLLAIATASVGVAAAAETRPGPYPGFLEQYTETGSFTNGRPRQAVATRDGRTVYFLRSGPRDRVHDLYAYDVAGAEARIVLTAASILQGAEERLTAEERARRERARQSARGIASFQLSPDDRWILVPLSGRLYVIERESGNVRDLSGAAGAPLDPRFSPDGLHIACVRNGDLYVIDVESGTERRLTHSATENISNGEAEFAAQEEMLRREGYWWSPDGRRIACQQTDVSRVERMHIPDLSNPQRAPRAWPYPRAGRDNAEVRLAILDLESGAPKWVEWDRERFPYLVTVRWDPNAPLTLVVHDRRQEEAQVLAVDDASGKTRLLLRETDPAWVQFHQSVPRWRADGQSFLWATERDGAWQLEARARDGRKLRTLTRDPVRYRELAGIDEASQTAWVQGWNDPTERHVYRVPLSGRGKSLRVTTERGEHDATMKAGRPLVAVEFTGTDGRYRHGIYTPDGRMTGMLPAATEEAPFEPSVEWVTLDAPLRMRASIVRPRDFVPGRRYPVLVKVYGGPHHQEVRAVQQRYLLDQWFADHGYLVVASDGRGTPGRGRAWERAIDGNLIEVSLADQVTAVHQLAARFPEMDLERTGVYGWSFGGYFTAMAVMRHPDLFRAGSAGAPVGDWRDYSTYYTERYMGLPDENAKGYDEASVLTWAPKLERPLLLMHGTADDNVYFLHSAKIADALFRAGKPFEFLPLSQFTHMVVDVEGRTRMYERMRDFFDAHLGAAK
jgi:dipeptidyl-peptidase-4